MDALRHQGTVAITAESPLSPDLDLLFARHVQAMHADTPPESIHMLPREDLVSPRITFLVMREAGEPVGMGALKRLQELADAGNPVTITENDADMLLFEEEDTPSPPVSPSAPAEHHAPSPVLLTADEIALLPPEGLYV